MGVGFDSTQAENKKRKTRIVSGVSRMLHNPCLIKLFVCLFLFFCRCSGNFVLGSFLGCVLKRDLQRLLLTVNIVVRPYRIKYDLDYLWRNDHSM